MATTQKETKSTQEHLARVRDNQRRSRARRKQYLSGLEDKFRRCEQYGAEASSEMQLAARRVLDENVRLRSILRSRGVSDQEIDSYAMSPTDPSNDSSQIPHGVNPQYPTPSQQLDQQLNLKRPCGSPDCDFRSDNPSACGSHSPHDVNPHNLSYVDSTAFETDLTSYLQQPHSQFASNLYVQHTSLAQNIHADASRGRNASIVSSTGRSTAANHTSWMPTDRHPSLTLSHSHTTESSMTSLASLGQHGSEGMSPPHTMDDEDLFANGGDSLQLLLSPTRNTRFMRYLGLDSTTNVNTTSNHENSTTEWNRNNRPTMAADLSPTNVPAANLHIDGNTPQVGTAYCHREKAWKRLDDPCWVTCSMVAAQTENNNSTT